MDHQDGWNILSKDERKELEQFIYDLASEYGLKVVRNAATDTIYKGAMYYLEEVGSKLVGVYTDPECLYIEDDCRINLSDSSATDVFDDEIGEKVLELAEEYGEERPIELREYPDDFHTPASIAAECCHWYPVVTRCSSLREAKDEFIESVKEFGNMAPEDALKSIMSTDMSDSKKIENIESHVVDRI